MSVIVAYSIVRIVAVVAAARETSSAAQIALIAHRVYDASFVYVQVVAVDILAVDSDDVVAVQS